MGEITDSSELRSCIQHLFTTAVRLVRLNITVLCKTVHVRFICRITVLSKTVISIIMVTITAAVVLSYVSVGLPVFTCLYYTQIKVITNYTSSNALKE